VGSRPVAGDVPRPGTRPVRRPGRTAGAAPGAARQARYSVRPHTEGELKACSPYSFCEGFVVVIAVCLPVLMMLLLLGMDAFENVISRPPPTAAPEAGEDPLIPAPSSGTPHQPR
jgi:hypothetical protein